MNAFLISFGIIWSHRRFQRGPNLCRKIDLRAISNLEDVGHQRARRYGIIAVDLSDCCSDRFNSVRSCELSSHMIVENTAFQCICTALLGRRLIIARSRVRSPPGPPF